MLEQCRKPAGWRGRLTLHRMNWSHSRVTDWGLSHIVVNPTDHALDVGCGGGRTLSKLATMATRGKVFGLDYSPEAVAASAKYNAAAIAAGRVEITQGSVSQLPWPDAAFDLVTAVETHFFWPDLPRDMREVFRVLKPGGSFCLIAEIYQGAKISEFFAAKITELTGMKVLSVDQHRSLLEAAGFTSVKVDANPRKGWICATGNKS